MWTGDVECAKKIREMLLRQDDDDDDGGGGNGGGEVDRRSCTMVYFLCGDTAHLHEKVLPEVVLGEFHAAVRTPSQPNRPGKAESAESQKSGGW